MSIEIKYDKRGYNIFLGDKVVARVREVGSEKKEDIFLSVCFKSMDHQSKIATVVVSSGDEKEEILLGDEGEHANKYGYIRACDRGLEFEDNNDRWMVYIFVGG